MRASGTDKGRLENQTSKQYLPCSKLLVLVPSSSSGGGGSDDESGGNDGGGCIAQHVLCSGLVQTRLSHRLFIGEKYSTFEQLPMARFSPFS